MSQCHCHYWKAACGLSIGMEIRTLNDLERRNDADTTRAISALDELVLACTSVDSVLM